MSGEPMRVLFVEDDASILQSITRRLQHEGYRVAAAPDGATASSIVESYDPDVALLDVHLPFADGLSVARHLDEALDRPIPKVFITASRDPDLRRQAEALGARAFIEKPFTTPYLLMVMRDIHDSLTDNG